MANRRSRWQYRNKNQHHAAEDSIVVAAAVPVQLIAQDVQQPRGVVQQPVVEASLRRRAIANSGTEDINHRFCHREKSCGSQASTDREKQF